MGADWTAPVIVQLTLTVTVNMLAAWTAIKHHQCEIEACGCCSIKEELDMNEPSPHNIPPQTPITPLKTTS